MNYPAIRPSRWLRVLVEAAIVCGVMTGSFRLADRFLEVADARTFIDWELKPAVMFGCGFGFKQPSAPTPAAERFILRKSGEIACQDFAWGGAPGDAIGIAFANRYSLYGAGWAMRWRGVSWETLDGYLAFLFAVSMAFTYGLFRMAAGRVLAVLGVAAIACSFTLAEIIALRDFVKLPCFTALWLALAWLVRRGLNGGARATIVPMAVAGGLMGLAIGFRMDALVFLPVFLAVALAGVPGFTRQDLIRKAAAAAAFVAMFMLAGRPILTSLAEGSNSAHVIVLGLMKPFDPGLSVEPAPYDIGVQYSDGYAFTITASYGLLTQGEQLPILLGSPKYDRIGRRLLRDLAAHFPSDVIARALGATAQIFRFPFEWRVRDLAQKQPTFQERPLVRTIGEWRAWALGFFAERELVTTLFVLILASAFNWRLGILGLAAILYFCGYSMLQFSRRHVFHLDVIPIFVVVLAVQLPIAIAWRVIGDWRRDPAEGRRRLKAYLREGAIGTALLALGIGLLFGSLAGARWYQQRHVRSAVAATLASPFEAVPISEEPLAPLILISGNPAPAWYEVYTRNPEQWKTGTMLRLPGVVPAGTEAAHEPTLRQQYFKITLDNRCGQSEVLIATSYSGQSQTYDHLYTRAFTINTAAGAPSYLLTPAYYHLGPSWNRLDGFGVPQEQRACITAIERSVDPAKLPMPMVAFALGPDWSDRPLYQQLMSRPRITMLGTPVDPLPTDVDTHGSGWRRHNDDPLAMVAPPLDAWVPSENVTLTKTAYGHHVVSNTVVSGYQLMSPPLDVTPGQTVAIQVVGRIVSGEMCVGILSGDQQRWLLAPSDARVGLLAETGTHNQVRVVFSNCARPPGEFDVRSISFESFIPQ